LDHRSARPTGRRKRDRIETQLPDDERYVGSMSDVASLTRKEARERAELISVERYDVAVDLRALFEGEVWSSTSTVSFSCRAPGAGTFVDCVGKVSSVTLNGRALDPATAERGRIPLHELAADNVLVVSSAQHDTRSGDSILRTVDPNDKLVYVWSSFEPDMARFAWACFDQPDLKAPHGFVVDAHESWTVTSNSAPDAVTDLDGSSGGGRRWTFGDTPPLSPYVTVVNAGPFHELRSTRGGYDLGLYARQSLKPYLERDAEELFDLTDRGLAFFGERFGQPFPQERYDQVFVPNMGGAMENWGSVTWTDSVLYRSTPTYGQRSVRAQILLHEMAHMWFGDLVTMQWWDDLWLNEAFASWASNWAAVNCTEDFTDEWATFLAGGKMAGYRQDMSPATHPIRGEVPDVAQAMANFDAITYIKGASVLKQLTAYVGEDAFVEGLRGYFREHAWGNTVLSDLMTSIGRAAGRDLDDWTVAWLDRAGTDILRLTDGAITATAPDDNRPRPHRLDVACYAVSDAGLTLVDTVAVETSGATTSVELPKADLHLLNATDLTFAAVRPDAESVRVLLERASELPAAVDRALAVVTGFQMLYDGELPGPELFTCVLGVLASEHSPSLVEPCLNVALEVAERWTPNAEIPVQLEHLAVMAAGLADDPEHTIPALRTLAAAATRDEHFGRLDAAAESDNDLSWRVATRRAALGRYDDEAVEALLDRDPDPDAAIRALAVRTARPDTAAKDDAWAHLFDKRDVPGGQLMGTMVRAFWQPLQDDVLAAYGDRFLDAIPSLAGGGMLTVFGLMYGMFPQVADDDFPARAIAAAAEPGCDPTVRAALLTGADRLTRMNRARAV
jgi:aminopeptidase N